jgi:DNA repair ATPase RecN
MLAKKYKQYIDDALERYKQILERLKEIENE